MAAIGLGVVAGPPFGGVVYSVGGKALPFYILAAVAGTDGILQLLLLSPIEDMENIDLLQSSSNVDSESTGYIAEYGLEAAEVEPERSRTKKRQGLCSLLRNAQVTRLCAVYMSISMLIGMLEPTFPIFMTDSFQSTPLSTGLIFITVAAAYMVSSPLCGHLGGRWSRYKVAAVGLIVLAASMPLVVLPPRDSKYYTIPPLLGVGAAMVSRLGKRQQLLPCPCDSGATCHLAPNQDGFFHHVCVHSCMLCSCPCP